jgi:hypothetical protein
VRDEDDKSWSLYAQTNGASSGPCGVRAPPLIILDFQLSSRSPSVVLLQATLSFLILLHTHTYTLKMSQRPEPLRLGSVAPNFDADTTNGYVD